MNLIQALVNAIRLPELRNKILFTGGILIIFRFFANVAVPGASQTALANLFNSQALLGLLDLFSGGGLSRFSVVAMGMNPYINATIIMQLMTVISERIKEIQKEGEMGRRRIQRWSRYLTVALGAGQAYGFTVLFQNTSPAILPVLDWFQRLEIIVVLTAGTIMLMWFGELITEYGIGNGVSLIIFAGIIGRGPQGVAAVFAAHTTGGGLADYVPFIVFGLIALVMTAVIIEVQQAVRKIPIQSAQRVAGGREVGRRASFLPLRFNPGIRPGKPTADHLAAVMNRVTFAGACFLGFITVILPIATAKISGIPHQQMYLGGTAILIVVGVALDTMKQLQTQLVMRQYRGFIK